MTESVIDFPKNTLCPEVWEKGLDVDGVTEVWKLTLEATEAIKSVLHLYQHATAIHITGSITSNQYTENADIDVHFLDSNIKDEKIAQEINEKLQSEYQDKVMVGKHPIEVYFQINYLQDLMSIGCYDYLKKKWLVGPELKDTNYNPYSKYYQSIQKKSEKLTQKIRNVIFSIYEIAVVLKKNNGTDLEKNLTEVLKSRLSDAAKLYDEIRNMRKVYSSPTSVEQALKYRNSDKWKVADGAFKLFDKYGYMAILKTLVGLNELIQNGNIADEVSTSILTIIKKYINNADKLSEKELYEDEQLDEGAKEAISMALLASLLAIPGITDAKTVHKTMKKAKTEQRAPVQAVDVLMSTTAKIGDYTEAQIANVITRTLYNEAQEDGDKGMYAVASVIFNRAKGNVADFVNVCKKPAQFSCWNKMTTEEWSPNRFKVRLSSSVNDNRTNQQIWEKAKKIASDMVKRKFRPTTNANAYYAPKKVKPKWDKDLTQRRMIGSHLFGVLTRHSEFI